MTRKSKLTEEQIAKIRSEYVPGKVGMKELAARYGVSISTISRILKPIRAKKK